MAASSKELGRLHEALARALAEQVEGFTEQTDEGEKVVKPSPALLGVAVTFLKNNNITADPDTNAALGELREKLAARRKGKISTATLDAAAEDFSQRFGTLQ